METYSFCGWLVSQLVQWRWRGNLSCVRKIDDDDMKIFSYAFWYPMYMLVICSSNGEW